LCYGTINKGLERLPSIILKIVASRSDATVCRSRVKDGLKMSMSAQAVSTNDVAGSTDDVAGLVRRIFEERSIQAVLAPDSDLRDLGLTSLDMVALVLSVEAEFDLMIPESQITPANFRSIATINALVVSLRG
jgi:acyl carrier protein